MKNWESVCWLGILFAVSIMQLLRTEKPSIMLDGFIEAMPAVMSSLCGLIVPLSYATDFK